MKTVLTGIKPSGTPHLGNYLGMIRPALRLAEEHRAVYFIADYHALTTVNDPTELRRLTYEVAATWLALGLDPDETVFYRQSDVPEVFELSWILGCSTPKGLLNRAHAYKDAVDENQAAGRSTDEGISAGLFDYPVLMSADILLFSTHFVPVGLDQKQHIEMTRDIAQSFNLTYGDVLTIPEAVIDESVMTIAGLDGRKMSKSYGNYIPLFASSSEMRKLVRRIVTDSRPAEEPKDPETCNVFNLYRHFAPPEEVAATRARYIAGGIGYGEVKDALYEHIEATLGKPREEYHALLADTGRIDEALRHGGQKARKIGSELLDRVRDAIGSGPRLA